MRIYLHIGIHKTGTTSLQRALRDNAALLAQNGVLYPASGRPDDDWAGLDLSLAHHLLPWALLRPATTSDQWLELRRELSHASEQVAILSSEEFDKVDSNDQFSRIRAELRGHDVKLIVYLRRQDEVLHAMYCSDVLHQREFRPFEVYRDSFRTELDYRVLLSRWEEWLGKAGLIVRIYEPKRLVGGDIVRDFFDKLGLGGLSLQVSTDRLSNRSFPRNIIKLIVALREAGVDEGLIGDVMQLAHVVYQGRTDSDMMSPAERRAIIAQYRDSNAYVARTYLGIEDGHLFGDADLGDEAEWEARYAAPCADVLATLGDAQRRLLDLANRADLLATLGDAHRRLLDLAT